jgi:SAM-dependent methyltransferase/acyl carrier protein
VKVRGFRVELGEVEGVLRGCVGVGDVVVVLLGGVLTAYLTAEHNMPESHRATDTKRITSQWQAIFEQEPDDAASYDSTFDTSGWVSSYTGLDYAPATMRGWLDATVDRILELRPRRVLEIGCGTGLVLFRVAPHCESYHAADFAAAPLAVLQRGLEETPLDCAVTVERRAAHELDDLADGQFDLVILNSVVQYFPGADYLTDVLAAAARVLAPGGSVFVGDVRAAGLRQLFHTSVQAFRSADDVSVGRLSDAVQRAMHDDEELLVDPVYFTRLASGGGRFAAAEIQPKLGDGDDEMTRYRYDVVLRTTSVGPPVRPDWQRLPSPDLRALAEMLRAARTDVVGVRAIPNLRLAADMALLDAVRSSVDDRQLRSLRRTRHRSDPATPTPETVVRTAGGLGWHARVSWAGCADDGSFDAVFTRDPAVLDRLVWPVGDTPDRLVATTPSLGARGRELARSVRDQVTGLLPDYMRPGRIIVLASLPTTVSGKIDYHALPSGQGEPLDIDENLVTTPGERGVLEILVAVLERSDLDLDQNFLLAGGDSLRALEVLSLLRERLSITLSFRQLMRCTSLRELLRLADDAVRVEVQS